MEFHNRTPLIPGFFSDPTICRTGDGFFIANSSFEYFPGAPVHRSTDLVEWELIGNVVTRPTQADLVTGGDSSGIFGSTIRFHDGRFYFITTNIIEVQQGQLLFTTEDAAGPWSDPVRVPVMGIDPDIAWDDEGNCYVTWCGFPHGISQVRIDVSTGALLTEPAAMWLGTGMRNPEGPHLYHAGDWWYLLIAEGGTDRGHSVSVARSRTPEGPWEGFAGNPILTHRSSAHPVQSVGHADLVEGPAGQWYAVYHGTRPHGVFPEFHVIGRETMIAKVEWRDGWPIIIEGDAEQPARPTSFSDDFACGLNPRWVSPSSSMAGVKASPAGLVLEAVEGSRPVVARVQDLEWSATATIDAAAGAARMLLYIGAEHWYGVEVRGRTAMAVAKVGPFEQRFASHEIPGTDPVRLCISAAIPPVRGNGWPANQPDLVTLACVDGGTFVQLAELDGRYISTEVVGGFTGRMVGVEALTGNVTVPRFEYIGNDAAE